MLDEMMEKNNVLNFKNVCPEVDCVTIYGFNELAYHFAGYLKKIGMAVTVIGELWERVFDIEEELKVPDFRNFIIYGEGCIAKQEEKDLRNSVSAEFECIDRVYEENIIRGIIEDADGTFQDFLERMRGKQIIICGTGTDALDAYDLLLDNGLDIFCFASGNLTGTSHSLFGKRILKRTEAVESVREPVFVEPRSQYSAWGFGEVDEFHYMGYKRNESYFLLRDYTEVPKNGFFHILSYVIEKTLLKLVLMGDYWLCLKLAEIIKKVHKNIHERIVYCDILNEH